ncbi:MAG: immunoglobulin domain-containing protein, partial [Verrucomicrobia bacterium]|nr:immunoglobulin domain-containing protein [Verrucomicrobiota bacterium]
MNHRYLTRILGGHFWLAWMLLSLGGFARAQGTQGTAPQGHNFGEISNLVLLGNPVSLVATVTSASPMTFTWSKDGRLVSGENAMTLTLPAVTKESAGTYRLKARNAFGFWESPPFLVAVYETGIEEVTLEAGKSIRLEPRALGPGLKYFWVGTGDESMPSHQKPILQIDRMQQGLQG